MKVSSPARWFLVPIAAMGGCAGTTVALGAVGRRAVDAVGPGFEAVLPSDARAGLLYGLAAIAFVVAGSLTAPRHRIAVALALYAAGAWLAWEELRHWYFPEGHSRGYQPSRVPLAVTLACGGLAVLIVIGHGISRGENRTDLSETRPPVHT